jgi:hypothetical protein
VNATPKNGGVGVFIRFFVYVNTVEVLGVGCVADGLRVVSPFRFCDGGGSFGSAVGSFRSVGMVFK